MMSNIKPKKPQFYYDKFWRQNFWIYYGWEEIDFAAHIKKNYDYTVASDSSLAGKVCYLENADGARDVLIIFVRKRPEGEMLVTLAHECLHAVNRCLKTRGNIFYWDNDEVQAYFLSRLMEEILTHEGYK